MFEKKYSSENCVQGLQVKFKCKKELNILLQSHVCCCGCTFYIPAVAVTIHKPIISMRPSRSHSLQICTALASWPRHPSSPSKQGPHPTSRSAVSSGLWKQSKWGKDNFIQCPISRSAVSKLYCINWSNQEYVKIFQEPFAKMKRSRPD